MVSLKYAASSADTQDIAAMVAEEVEEATSFFQNLVSPVKSAIPTVILAIICALIGFVFVKILMRIINHALKRTEIDGIAVGFLRSVIKIILYVLLAVILLSILHVPMDSIVAVIVSSSMAVALALKDSLANVAGGFILLFAKPVKAGDVIEVDGSKGKVESVGILYTKIVTLDNVAVFIPNGKVSSAKIINYTQKELRRVDLRFTIAYESDIDQARKVLLKSTESFGQILSEPQPTVHVSAHQDSAIELLLCVWVNTEDYWSAYYCLLEQVKKDFDAAGISIPYPQIDVHQK